MAVFEIHWPDILFEEGSTLVPEDFGAGRAQYGVTELNNPEVWADGQVTEEEAKQVYKNKYWRSISGDHLSSEGMAGALLDSAINTGSNKAIRLAQTALGVTVDGALGPITLGALNSVDELTFLNDFADLRELDYKAIYERNYPKYPEVVLTVWLARANRYRGIKNYSATGSILPTLAVISVFFFG